MSSVTVSRVHSDRQTDRQAARQAGKQTQRQIDRQKRDADRKTGMPTVKLPDRHCESAL